MPTEINEVAEGLADEPAVIMETFAGGEIITEFRGNFPEVPTRSGFALTEVDDPEPFFVTLEISREGRVSKNGLMHDAPLGEALVKQIMEGAPTGIMGHLSDSERQTSYPLPDGYWVGAAKRGEVTYGKVYIPKTKEAVREHYRMLKRTGGKAATSIYGSGVREVVDRARGVWRLKNVNLEQIDFAPFERAALAPETDFTITAEMADPGEAPAAGQDIETESPVTEVTTDMDRNEVIAELTATDAKALPAAVREAIIAEYEAQSETQDRIAELEGTLTTTNARVAELEGERDELKTQIAEFEREQFENDVVAEVAKFLDWPVNDDDGKAKLESLRKSMRRAVKVEHASREDVGLSALVAELWEGEFKVQAEAVRDTLAGPAAVVGSMVDKSNGVIAELEAKYGTPEAQQQAAAGLGIVGG